MQKSMVRKGLVVGIIVLFIGASVTPSISGNIRESSKVEDVKDLESEKSQIKRISFTPIE